jgi:riboflavin kinase/FMN adenylyltransferase
MERLRLGSAAAADTRGSAVAVGNFDGVHQGHQSLVRAAVASARPAGRDAVVLTFDPHPARVLRPELAPAALSTLAQKEELVAALGAPRLVVLEFDAAVAALAPEAFAREVLEGALGAREVVIGESFRFGRAREGDARRLAELGAKLGFAVQVVRPVLHGGRPISSSRVREALASGDVREAELLLGRPYALDAVVVHGEGRGGRIGIPTANLQPEGQLVPRPGVYAGRCRLPGREIWPAVVNVGRRPTFGGGDLTVEAHLLDYEGDLYGARVRLAFSARLRDEQRFESVAALVARIREDVRTARELLLPPPGAGRL